MINTILIEPFGNNQILDVDCKVNISHRCAGDITAKIINTIVSGLIEQGRHEVKFNASALSSGIYFYKLIACGHQFVRKMIVLK